MQNVIAEWYEPAEWNWVDATTPVDLLRGIAAIRGTAHVRDGRMLLHAIDAVPNLSDWAMVVGLEPRHRELMGWTSDLIIGGGFEAYRAQIPFVRYGGGHAVAVRVLSMYVGQSFAWRVWGPLRGTADRALDPFLLRADGTPMERGSDWVEDTPPNHVRSRSNLEPVDQLIAELDTAWEALRAAVDGVRSDIAHADVVTWQRPRGRPEHDFGAMGVAVHELAIRGRELRREAGRLAEAFDVPPDHPAAGPLDLTSPDLAKRRARVDRLRVGVDKTAERIDVARAEVRQAAHMRADLAVPELLVTQDANRTASDEFQRKAALFAAVIAGPTVIAGLAGANIDFWPVPMKTAGALPVVLALCAGAGVVVYRWLRPRQAAARDDTPA